MITKIKTSFDHLPYEQLFPSLIDRYAEEEPQKVWLEMPIDDDDLSKGFRPVTYSQLATLVDNAAHWLDEALGKTTDGSTPVFAYTGQQDLRFAILVLAAIKVGRCVLLPFFPIMNDEARRFLISKTGCSAILHGKERTELAQHVATICGGLNIVPVPDLDEMFGAANQRKPYPYTKSWEEGKSDPILIVHTSGTTGHPKPVVYNQYMMQSWSRFFRASRSMGIETNLNSMVEIRYCVPVAYNHYAGINTLLQAAILLDAPIVVPPPLHGPISGEQLREVIKYGHIGGILTLPSIIQDMYHNSPESQSYLEDLESILYAGAPLNKDVGDALSRIMQVGSGIGTTEAGVLVTVPREAPDENWQYVEFHPLIGAALEPFGAPDEGLFELLLLRDPKLQSFQQIFDLRPDQDRYEVGDVFRRHRDPKLPHLWKYEGRTDDIINLSDGESMPCAAFEQALGADPRVLGVAVGGANRSKACAVLELADSTQLEDVILKYNASSSERFKLDPRLAIIAKTAKPFAKTAKDTVARAKTLVIYADEIQQAYAQAGIP